MNTFAIDLRLKPSTRTVLAHLKARRTISPVEAFASYGIMRLAPAIYDLRKAGYTVSTKIRRDGAGHSYARYSLKEVQ